MCDGCGAEIFKGELMKQFHQQLVKKALMFERNTVVRAEKHLTWN